MAQQACREEKETEKHHKENHRQKMKIGILTYHRAHNYGAVLQCYALLSYLKQKGAEVVVIDYRPSYFKYGLFVWYKWLSLNPIKLIKKLSHQTKTFCSQKRRYDAFENFINTFILPRQVDLTHTKSDIDCFIFGSDQIWRKNGNMFDPIFWGDFKAAQDTKLASYAASMGKATLTESENVQVKNWLSRFSDIMVRETSLKKLLSSLTEKEVKVVVDPTLLLTSQEWDKVAVRPNRKKPYILVYQVIEHPATLRLAHEAAKQLGAEIIEIASKVDRRKGNHELIYDASPNEFVGWVADAAMVVTTSFHGTAFSIIYRKPFVSIKQHKPSDLRISSILETCDLADRFIDCDAESLAKTVYLTPHPKLDAVSISKHYLNTLLEEK